MQAEAIHATHRGGGRFEDAAGYVRGRRIGDRVLVSGTVAVEPSGRVHAPGDTGAQTRYALGRIGETLSALGSSLQDVVLVRAYLAPGADVAAFAAAHREVLGDVRPVLTAVTCGLATPGIMVEIEVEAQAGVGPGPVP